MVGARHLIEGLVRDARFSTIRRALDCIARVDGAVVPVVTLMVTGDGNGGHSGEESTGHVVVDFPIRENTIRVGDITCDNSKVCTRSGTDRSHGFNNTQSTNALGIVRNISEGAIIIHNTVISSVHDNSVCSRPDIRGSGEGVDRRSNATLVVIDLVVVGFEVIKASNGGGVDGTRIHPSLQNSSHTSIGRQVGNVKSGTPASCCHEITLLVGGGFGINNIREIGVHSTPANLRGGSILCNPLNTDDVVEGSRGKVDIAWFIGFGVGHDRRNTDDIAGYVARGLDVGELVVITEVLESEAAYIQRKDFNE